ncbi:hypothetical protein BA894_01300 [Vibrio natriegens]|uniref:DUF6932 family protein n=1 Tax=Vibrio natriegens TaxID=691 RepID=UPI00080449FD|nr:hypothetical protein [Vibrio natriegens]ANQ25166.1 hypothetical protein BA894_01300 [Vibrio natriegens]
MSICFTDIPLAPWPVLQEGVHQLSLEEFREVFVFNPHRRKQFEGLVYAMKALKQAGCTKVYIDGSYVTKKPTPGDYDACWDVENVDPDKLDKVFLDFDNGRASQKAKYEGEFFPAHWAADSEKTSYKEFFQKEKHSGGRKGIVLLELGDELDS